MKIVAWPAFRKADENPYTSLLYMALTRLGVEVMEFSPRNGLSKRFNVLHVHWPEAVLNNPSRFRACVSTIAEVMLLVIIRLKGARIVWTIHNLEAHDRRYPILNKALAFALVRLINGWIVLVPDHVASALVKYPTLRRKAVQVIPHGHYCDIYPEPLKSRSAKVKLGVSSTTFLVVFWGQIRHYKNVPLLLKAFADLADDNLALLVAGNATDDELKRTIINIAEQDTRVEVAFGFLEPSQIALISSAADLIVLPYEQILNSGTAIASLGYGTPLLVPHSPVFTGLQELLGSDVVHMYHGQLTTETLHSIIEAIRLRPVDASEVRNILSSALSWDKLGYEHLQFFRRLFS